MAEPTVELLLDGLAFGESPRWRDGRLWVCDWGAHELVAIDGDGDSEVAARVESFPFCIDWLPGGSLLVVSAAHRAVLRREPDGSFATYAELGALSEHPWNEIAVDRRGNAYVNGIGFDLGAGAPPAPGLIALVTPAGDAREVAGGLEFPNGMAITPDGSTLICAESYGNRLTAFDVGDDGGLSGRRTWADLGDGAPDGICLDAEGAVWVADVPNRSCTRVAEGGEVLETIELDRGCFSCALGGPDGRTLFMVTREWTGPESVADTRRTGQVVVTRAAVPAAARPAT